MAEPVKRDEYYTYADYLTWDDDERWELIDGTPFLMSPAPSPRHQRVLAEILTQLVTSLRGNPCQVYGAPFDVRLDPFGADATVAQPDISVVCDSSKIDNRGCNGAPDFVLEIISPASLKRDRYDKFRAYQKAGVREYWIVDLENQLISVNILNESQEFVLRTYSRDEDGIVPLIVLDCEIDFTLVFRDIPLE